MILARVIQQNSVQILPQPDLIYQTYQRPLSHRELFLSFADETPRNPKVRQEASPAPTTPAPGKRLPDLAVPPVWKAFACPVAIGGGPPADTVLPVMRKRKRALSARCDMRRIDMPFFRLLRCVAPWGIAVQATETARMLVAAVLENDTNLDRHVNPALAHPDVAIGRIACDNTGTRGLRKAIAKGGKAPSARLSFPVP